MLTESGLSIVLFFLNVLCLGIAGLDSPQQFLLGELRYHKHFLCTCAFAGKHLEAARYRYRYTQLEI